MMTPILESMDSISLAALSTLAECRIKQFTDCDREFERLEVRSCRSL